MDMIITVTIYRRRFASTLTFLILLVPTFSLARESYVLSYGDPADVEMSPAILDSLLATPKNQSGTIDLAER